MRTVQAWNEVIAAPRPGALSVLAAAASALQGQRANKGIFLTTSKFTREALEFVSQIGSKIVLIDGEQLAQLMMDNNVGVSVAATYEIKRIDSDYFTEGA